MNELKQLAAAVAARAKAQEEYDACRQDLSRYAHELAKAVDIYEAAVAACLRRV